jgi:hypothetical protein
LKGLLQIAQATAKRYIQLASNRTRVSDLGEMSLRKALDEISKEEAASFDAHGFFCFGGQTGRGGAG